MELLITRSDRGWQVVASPDGRPPYERRGPAWLTPAEAARFFDSILTIPKVSPLRTPPELAPLAPAALEAVRAASGDEDTVVVNNPPGADTHGSDPVNAGRANSRRAR
jgi:hypothetical protein